MVARAVISRGEARGAPVSSATGPAADRRPAAHRWSAAGSPTGGPGRSTARCALVGRHRDPGRRHEHAPGRDRRRCRRRASPSTRGPASSRAARRATDRAITLFVASAFAIAGAAARLGRLRHRRHRGLDRFDSQFFTEDVRNVVGAGGGGLHAIVGTLVITGLTTLASVPIGIMCAVYLNEYGHGRLKQAIIFFVDVMTGIPSIVAGLFAFALFSIFMGPGHPPRRHGRRRPLGADDPDRGALDRGDAEDRPERPPRGVLRARACPSGGRS